MFWLTVFQAIVFISYITFLLIKFKKPLPSISDSWYELSFPLNSLFWVFCTLLGVANIFQGDQTALFFLGGAGLCLTGVASAFNSDHQITKGLHFLGAFLVIFCSLLGLGIERNFWFSTFLFTGLSALIFLTRLEDRIWWIECVAFASILLGYFLTL